MLRDKKRNFKGLSLILWTIVIIIAGMSIAFGAADITLPEVIKISISKLPIIGARINLQGIESSHIAIILNIRLPRIILAGLVGMGLAVVGAVYQGIFKNPMADPFVLGISSGSSLGAALSIVFGFNLIGGIGSTAITAFTFGLLTTYFVYNIARVGNRAAISNLLLAGMAVSFFTNAILSLIMVLNHNQVEKIIFWTMGSFAIASWKQVWLIAFVTIPLIIIIFLFSREINVITTGDNMALSLGVNVEKIKKLVFILASLIIATGVSVCGIIGFIGLIIPHGVKILSGSDYKKLIPYSAAVGAGFMILSDTLARTIIAPIELPVGAITAVFGTPYFIFLLYKNKRKVF